MDQRDTTPRKTLAVIAFLSPERRRAVVTKEKPRPRVTTPTRRLAVPMVRSSAVVTQRPNVAERSLTTPQFTAAAVVADTDSANKAAVAPRSMTSTPTLAATVTSTTLLRRLAVLESSSVRSTNNAVTTSPFLWTILAVLCTL